MTEVKILNEAGNIVVAKLSYRQYPGILIQGDTLRGILGDLEELDDELLLNNLDSAKEVAEILKQRLSEILIHYENVLTEYGFTLPYMKSLVKQ